MGILRWALYSVLDLVDRFIFFFGTENVKKQLFNTIKPWFPTQIQRRVNAETLGRLCDSLCISARNNSRLLNASAFEKVQLFISS